MNRGDVYEVHFPAGRRPATIITRQSAIPFLTRVTVAPITSTIRGIPTEVKVDRAEGLDHESAINCDNIQTLSKERLLRRRGTLGPERMRALDGALLLALGLDHRPPRCSVRG